MCAKMSKNLGADGISGGGGIDQGAGGERLG